MRSITDSGRLARRFLIAALVAGCVAAGLAATGNAGAAGDTRVELKAGKGKIEWQVEPGFEKILLLVSGQGRLVETEFEAGTTPVFDLRDRRGEPLPDGEYAYQLTVLPKVEGTDRRRLAEARSEVDADAASGEPGPFILTGTLAVREGAVADAGLERQAIPLERPFQPEVKVGGDMVLWGNLTVRGLTSLASLDPEDGKRSIHYGALQGPEAGLYLRGTARLSGGETVIELPAHFAKLAEKQGLTVQLTPVGAWSRLYVAEKSPHRLVVREAEGTGDAVFDYLVQGVRSDYADFEVERSADDRWTFPEPR